MNAPAETNHALGNAQSWLETIKANVAALECDYDRLQELRDARAEVDTPETQAGFAAFDASEEGEELRELEAAAGEFESQEQAQERIQEEPLSIELCSGWYTPGDTPEASEFCILLTTGGPALRIIGDLDQHKQPTSPRLQYQDWGTPWTELICTGEDHDALQAYCEQFYFGE